MFRKELQLENQKNLEENIYLLSKATVKTKLSRFHIRHDVNYPFEGKIEKDSFEIRPIVTHRSSFLPIIKGNLTEKDGKTTISLSLAPTESVFFILWALTVLCVFIGVLIAIQNPVLIFLPFLLLIFMWSFAVICIRMEKHEAVQKLEKIFLA